MSRPPFRVAPLDAGHDRTVFDSGSEPLDRYFREQVTQDTYAGLGLYYDKRAEIAQSNVTGWYYTQKEKSALNMGGELGLQCRTSGGTLWGIGYHTIRGGFVSLAW